MPLNIRPLNDFAFRKTFATERNRLALIGLLNAILQLPHPIVEIQILDPFNLQDYESDKLSIVDVKAIDSIGANYHIEVQLNFVDGLIQRVVFYGCELFASQLSAGGEYTELKPVYSIWLLDAILFKDATNLHHRFRLSDTATGRVLDELLEIHILELPRYNQTVDELPMASKRDWWLFWLLRAQDYEPEELLRLFPEAEFQQATRSLIEIAEKTRDKMAYDKRELAIRDQQAAITTALKEGERRGELKGRQEGERRGELLGRIVTLQELLSHSTPTREELSSYNLTQLTAVCEQVQKQLRDRDV